MVMNLLTHQAQENDAWTKWKFQQKENINIKKYQAEITEINIWTKIPIQAFNSRLDEAEERLSELQDKAVEFIP